MNKVACHHRNLSIQSVTHTKPPQQLYNAIQSRRYHICGPLQTGPFRRSEPSLGPQLLGVMGQAVREDERGRQGDELAVSRGPVLDGESRV